MDLSFIIVIGTRWHFRRIAGGWDGVLNCPACESPQHFVEKEAFKALTLYWFPLFRTEHGGRLVECSGCKGKFDFPEFLPVSGRSGEFPAVGVVG